MMQSVDYLFRFINVFADYTQCFIPIGEYCRHCGKNIVLSQQIRLALLGKYLPANVVCATPNNPANFLNSNNNRKF